LQNHPFGSHGSTREQTLSFGSDPIQHLVVVIRIVVEDDQMLGLRGDRHPIPGQLALF